MFVLGLADGKLVRWTKGFSCEGVEGENVVDLLQAAIARRGDVRIEICAILNDTTGNLKDGDCCLIPNDIYNLIFR